MERLLQNLTEPQREAVTHRDGPLLVLAGPGSGKTRVITHRIAYLIENGVPPTQILALTFTNKAADEMQRRVAELVPYGAPSLGSFSEWGGGRRGVWLSTFHRFGAMLLRQYAGYVGLEPNFTIYDTSDSRQTIKRVIEAREINTLNYSPERLADAISAAKNKLITADRYEPRSGSMLGRVVAEVYPAYQERLLASSAVDFDDLLLHVAQLLYDHAEIRSVLDERYRYVLVDEYQDTNRAQYVILRALSTDYPNLAVTGDPDQSIYGWRGADLNNILEFEHDYPNVKIVRLERNYRSTKRIL
ncbi:MAG TPA: UvrD-helicase domain-containing protein, partial [Lacipirellulaceae bacterium]|nr:UvrD-helicase domain-containing protein [Lacipirellulaceae bacterium]